MKTIIHFAVGLSAAVAMVACSKQMLPQAEDTSPPIVREAKAAFATQFSATKSSDYEQFNPGTIIPDWDKAVVCDSNRVDIPSQVTRTYRTLQKERVDGKDTSFVSSVYQQLTAIRASDSTLHLYVMTLIPDRHSASRDGAEPFRGYSAKDRGGFSGIVIYTLPNGEQVQIVQYRRDGSRRSVWFSNKEIHRDVLIARAQKMLSGIGWTETAPQTKGKNADQPCKACGNKHEDWEMCTWTGPEINVRPAEKETPRPEGEDEVEWPEDLGGSGGRGGGGTTGETPGDGGGGSGSGNGNNPTDPPLDSGKPWPKHIHDKIIESALKDKLTKDQLDALKYGSEFADADQYQDAKHVYMHAMRNSNQSILEASENLKKYFITQITTYKRTSNYFALGMALHPIMDAYASPHEGFGIYDSWVDLANHYAELSIVFSIENPNRFDNAANTLEWLFPRVQGLSSTTSTEEISALYTEWLSGYVSYLYKGVIF